MLNQSIDKLNTGLIVGALILAYCIPFKLFLLSYAILGPLHYLTEIHWLKTKQYFISQPSFRMPVLVLFAVAISLFSFAKLFKPWLTDSVYHAIYGTVSWANTLLFSSFLFVLLSKILKSRLNVLGQVLLAITVGVGLKFLLPKGLSYFGLFVPTLLHVYVFTVLFMLYGLRKKPTSFGSINVYLLVLVPIFIALLPFPLSVSLPSEADMALLNESRFTQLHFVLAQWTSQSFSKDFVYSSVFGRKIQIFIAFAYLYHYLNWFSKTSLIGWKTNLNNRSLVAIILIWSVSLAIYWYDFATGFMALFFLSFLHVVLEFPLNLDTIKALVKRN